FRSCRPSTASRRLAPPAARTSTAPRARTNPRAPHGARPPSTRGRAAFAPTDPAPARPGARGAAHSISDAKRGDEPYGEHPSMFLERILLEVGATSRAPIFSSRPPRVQAEPPARLRTNARPAVVSTDRHEHACSSRRELAELSPFGWPNAAAASGAQPPRRPAKVGER